MKNILSMKLPQLLISACALVFSQAFALAQPWDFQADARMYLQDYGPVEDAYGLVYLETDGNGDGVITVMFSNASEVELARFNARVRFLDTHGGLLGEEHFDCWIDSAGYVEANECKLSRPLSQAGFDSIEVDFYLSDVAAAVGILARQ